MHESRVSCRDACKHENQAATGLHLLALATLSKIAAAMKFWDLIRSLSLAFPALAHRFPAYYPVF
jgi:hypothetical protein